MEISTTHKEFIFHCQMFRHGDRAPVKTFPTDPNQDDVWPQGLGQLTTVMFIHGVNDKMTFGNSFSYDSKYVCQSKMLYASDDYKHNIDTFVF